MPPIRIGAQKSRSAVVFNIQRFSIHDGPGIRTTVFVKGCPLHCLWCCNPESLNEWPELGLIKARCNNCGKCVEACPEQAIAFDQGICGIHRDRCTDCGKCVEVCYPKALALYGKEMTAEDVYEVVRRDDIFYKSSSGGVTLSGGEPLQHPAFTSALLQLCREAGIHSAVETSGYVNSEVLKRVLMLVNFVLFDFKHMDSEVHRRFTGRPNKIVLANAKVVAMSGVPVLFRMPLIPGVNDTEKNIGDTACFLKTLGDSACSIELMPYHRLGQGKYQALDRTYGGGGITPPEPSRVEWVRQRFQGLGIQCKVSE